MKPCIPFPILMAAQSTIYDPPFLPGYAYKAPSKVIWSVLISFRNLSQVSLPLNFLSCICAHVYVWVCTENMCMFAFSFLVSLCMCVSVCLPRLFPTKLFLDRIFHWAWIFKIVQPGWPCSISTVLGLNPVWSCLPLHMCSGNGTEFLMLSQQAFCWLSHFLSSSLHFYISALVGLMKYRLSRFLQILHENLVNSAACTPLSMILT